MANGLGRGLGSLIPKKINIGAADAAGNPSSAGGAVVSDAKNGILQVSPDEITTNPQQPRREFAHQPLEELVESIKQYGIIMPLVVTKKGNGYELIAGERRLRASKIAGFEKVPVIVREAKEQEKLELALIENIQRENLNPVEQAAAYKKLIDEFDLSQDDMAKRVGKARSSVANSLRLLTLPQEIQQALVDGKITEGHAKIIAGLESEIKQLALYKKIVHNSLPVVASAKEARVMGGTKAARIKVNYADKDKEETLREFFGAKAEIKRKGKGGQIVVDFYGEDELNGIMEKIKN